MNCWDQVGNTELVYLHTLSESTGCHIWCKKEFKNPGGSIKDRAAKQIILEAEQEGKLKTGDTIVEGTAGNTGIGLAILAIPRGYKVIVMMPNNQSQEKVTALTDLGAEVLQFAPCPFSNPAHFYHQARRYAEQHSGVFWANQFENLANFRSHLHTTGPEIWQQTQEKIDIFVASVGTGGTVAGVSQFLKKQRSGVEIYVVDPMGSGIYEFVRTGQFKTEGSSITEGIGIMRLTENFKHAMVDQVIRINDQEMINMLYYLKDFENLLVGTSSALNVAAAFRVAKNNRGSRKTIVTMLCDHGERYRSKILSPSWLQEKHLLPQPLEF